MDNVTVSQLLQRINQLELEQSRLDRELERLASDQSQDHTLLLEVQQQLAQVYREIESIKNVLTTKIEESNAIILEQNKLMMANSNSHFEKIYKLVTVLIIALLLVIGVKGLSAIPWF